MICKTESFTMQFHRNEKIYKSLSQKRSAQKTREKD